MEGGKSYKSCCCRIISSDAAPALGNPPCPSFSIAVVTKLPGNIIIAATASHVSTILPSGSTNAYNRVETSRADEFERGNISRQPSKKRQGKRVELGGGPISLDVIKNRSTGI